MWWDCEILGHTGGEERRVCACRRWGGGWKEEVGEGGREESEVGRGGGGGQSPANAHPSPSPSVLLSPSSPLLCSRPFFLLPFCFPLRPSFFDLPFYSTLSLSLPLTFCPPHPTHPPSPFLSFFLFFPFLSHRFRNFVPAACVPVGHNEKTHTQKREKKKKIKEKAKRKRVSSTLFYYALLLFFFCCNRHIFTFLDLNICNTEKMKEYSTKKISKTRSEKGKGKQTFKSCVCGGRREERTRSSLPFLHPQKKTKKNNRGRLWCSFFFFIWAAKNKKKNTKIRGGKKSFPKKNQRSPLPCPTPPPRLRTQ